MTWTVRNDFGVQHILDEQGNTICNMTIERARDAINKARGMNESN